MNKKPACWCADRGGRCDDKECDHIRPGPYTIDQCRVCWLWQNGGLKPVVGRGACVHLGAITDDVRECQTCGMRGVKVPLHTCGKFGRCYTEPRAWLSGVQRCGPVCPSYEAAGPPVADPGRVRHLLYHVYPHAKDRGAVWRWNVAKLKRRLSLFNGRRMIGVAIGPETEPASAVRDALAGCGCQFIEVANDPGLREVTTFAALLESVADLTGPEHATFYGHAKGVSSEAWAPGVRRWTDAMYSACLDHWPAVRRVLTTRPVVGAFKRVNYGFPESWAPWHYHGSFRWHRNADLFARDWRTVDQAWIGTESHVGLHFGADEAAALVHEFAGDGLALYLEETWRAWGQAAVDAFHERHLPDRWQPLLLTCVLVSHRKPRWVHEAVASVLAQTTADWRLVVIDSGDLLAAGAFDRYRSDPRVTVTASGETEAMRRTHCLQSWCYNEAYRRGLATGDLIHYLPDDDVLDPGIFAAWLDAARGNPEQSAWYGPADRCEVRGDAEVKVGDLPTFGPVRTLDNRADGFQVCHRTSVRVEWPEDPTTAWHADGVWMDALGRLATIHPVAAKVGRHRHTADSTFTRPG